MRQPWSDLRARARHSSAHEYNFTRPSLNSSANWNRTSREASADKITSYPRVVSVLHRGELGLSTLSRPRGSFLFLGPTGVGKTELTIEFTRYLFGNDRLFRFDMSEYQTQDSTRSSTRRAYWRRRPACATARRGKRQAHCSLTKSRRLTRESSIYSYKFSMPPA